MDRVEESLLTVGQLAKAMNVTVRTLQYYDKEGLLKPSELSEGGRRLYSKKDMVKLHQILSLKQLGFPLDEIKQKIFKLDTPQEVAMVLENQARSIEEQIKELQNILKQVNVLHDEVLLMNQVDFSKYADIVSLVKLNNPNYWAWKLFDDKLTDHVRERYGIEKRDGKNVMEVYLEVLDEAIRLKNQNEPPNSEKSLALSKKWWDMIMEFTGGDFSLLPGLMKFNENKDNWQQDLAEKQKEADGFIEVALGAYFDQQKINIPGFYEDAEDTEK